MNEIWKIIVQKASGFQEKQQQGRVNPSLITKRWATYLVLIPILILLSIFGVFFFAAFLALFAIAAAGFGVRFWWLRRSLNKSEDLVDSLKTENKETVEGEYTVVDEDGQAGKERAKRGGANN
tara:strand:+ start:539 stop:907 length:369 start_codon:yes stop_codon:yes gene_type:complete